MRTIDATPHKPIPLGKTGTNNTLTVRFDVTKWIESYLLFKEGDMNDCIIQIS